MMSLSNIQNSSLLSATGYCATSQDALDVVNQVIPRLLNRGDWPGTVMPVRVCIRNGCVTWPRYVGQVRLLHSCRGDIPMKSVWYEFLDYRGDHHRYGWESWRGQERRMTNQFQSSVYNDIYGPNCTVRMYVDLTADVNSTCTIYGTDNNNQPLQTVNTDGTASLGQTFSVQIQSGPGGHAYWGSTTSFVSRIDRVVCSATQGMKRLYAYDATQNTIFDLAVYEPSETNPSYVRQQLEGERMGQWGGGNCTQSVIALVKLKFVPVSAPTDGLIFLDGAQGAIYHGCRAVKREEAGDSAGALTFWKSAVEELNRQLEDYVPDDQIAVKNEVFAGRNYHNHMF